MPRAKATPQELQCLKYALLRDPLSVLTHFQQAGVHYLSELRGWPQMRKVYPHAAQSIADVAAMLDIPEWPD